MLLFFVFFNSKANRKSSVCQRDAFTKTHTACCCVLAGFLRHVVTLCSQRFREEGVSVCVCACEGQLRLVPTGRVCNFGSNYGLCYGFYFAKKSVMETKFGPR